MSDDTHTYLPASDIADFSLPADLGIDPPPEMVPGATYAGPPASGPIQAAGAAPDAAGMGPEPGHQFVNFNANVTVEGIEATQGTQFYKSSRHLPPGQAEADNAMTLIDNKHLAIRVYPDLVISGWPRFPVSNVDGDVWFKRLDISDTYKKAARLNGAIPGRRAITIDRGQANQTLNFRISDLYTRNRIVVYARVWIDVLGQRKVSPWFGRVFNLTAIPHVRIRAHGINYQRGAINSPAPTLADFIATGVYLRKTFPMSRFNFLSYDVINFGGDLTDTSGGGCGAGWNALWQQLRNLYFASGQDANHYGLMQPGIPTAYGGCGGGFVGASFVGGGSVMAQELGHGLGWSGHAPGCGAGGPNPNYPQYNGYSSGSIGEYGMDYATGAVYNPANSTDFMGYCGNRWVSPFTYRELINGIQNQPGPAPGPSAANAESEFQAHTEDHLYLGFRISCNGDVDLLSGITLNGPAARAQGTKGHHSVELHDAKGNVLYAKRLVLEEAHQDLSHSHTEYFESVPAREGAAKLVFKCGHENGPTVINLPKQAPELTWKQTSAKQRGPMSGKYSLDWAAKAGSGQKLTYMVRYSNDGGETWRPVAVGLTVSKYEADLDTLPGGDDCRFEVLASTILSTSSIQSERISVARTPRQAMIAPVPDTAGNRPHNHIELAGCAYSPDGCCDDDEMIWNSSVEGFLGTGCHLIANNLVAGEHVISLIAPADDDGSETRAEYRVMVPHDG